MRSFTEDPRDIAGYGPLFDAAGQRKFELEISGTGAKGLLIGRVPGIEDRTAADALKGTELFVDRSLLPNIRDDEVFYQADLIGLEVRDRVGARIGEVAAVHNFGAGDILEIKASVGTPNGADIMLAFTRAAVPVIELAAGYIVAEPPDVTDPASESEPNS